MTGDGLYVEAALDAAVILSIRSNVQLTDDDLEAVRAVALMYQPRTTGKLARALGMSRSSGDFRKILERLQKAGVFEVYRNGRLDFSLHHYALRWRRLEELRAMRTSEAMRRAKQVRAAGIRAIQQVVRSLKEHYGEIQALDPPKVERW